MLLSRLLLSQTALPPEEALPSPGNAMPSTPLTGCLEVTGGERGRLGRRKPNAGGGEEKQEDSEGIPGKWAPPSSPGRPGPGAGGEGLSSPGQLLVARALPTGRRRGAGGAEAAPSMPGVRTLTPGPRPQEGPGVSQQRLTHRSLACPPLGSHSAADGADGAVQCGRSKRSGSGGQGWGPWHG